jgi:hypothetical protein
MGDVIIVITASDWTPWAKSSNISLFGQVSGDYIEQNCKHLHSWPQSGNTKGGSITERVTSCLTGLESAV